MSCGQQGPSCVLNYPEIGHCGLSTSLISLKLRESLTSKQFPSWLVQDKRIFLVPQQASNCHSHLESSPCLRPSQVRLDAHNRSFGLFVCMHLTQASNHLLLLSFPFWNRIYLKGLLYLPVTIMGTHSFPPNIFFELWILALCEFQHTSKMFKEILFLRDAEVRKKKNICFLCEIGTETSSREIIDGTTNQPAYKQSDEGAGARCATNCEPHHKHKI